MMQPHESVKELSFPYDGGEVSFVAKRWSDPDHLAITQEMVPPDGSAKEVMEWMEQKRIEMFLLVSSGYRVYEALDDDTILWTKGHPDAE